MQEKKGFTPEDGSFPFDGMDLTCPAVLLPPTSSPLAVNLTTFQGTLKKRQGYSLVTRIGVINQSILKMYDFERGDGTHILVMWTETGVYSWSGNPSDAPINLMPEQTVVILPAMDGFGNGWQFGDPYTGFVMGQYVLQETSGAFGIAVSGSMIRVISGVFDATHVINAVATSTRGGLDKVTPNGTTTADTENIAGGLNNSIHSFIDVTEGVDTNLGRILVFTNGIDPPMYWDGISGTFTYLPMNLEKFCSCKCLAVYNSYLILANIQTTDDFEPRTAAWSDTGVFTEWQSGNAGVLVETAVGGDILRLIPFTDVLAMFTTESIGCLCYINSDVIFGSRVYVTGINIVGPGAICKLNPFITFVSLDNLYMWDGGRTVTAIADKVAPSWKTLRGTEFIKRTTLFYDPLENQLRWVVYLTETSVHQYVLNASLTNATFYNSGKTDVARWFEYQLTNSVQSYTNFKTGSSSSTLIGSTNGFLYQHDTSGLDEGRAFFATWDTPDLTIPGLFQSDYGRWLEIEFEASGSDTVQVSYSLDRGSVYSTADTITLATGPTNYRIPIDITSRTFRLSFTTDSNDFNLTWFRVWYRPGGAR